MVVITAQTSIAGLGKAMLLVQVQIGATARHIVPLPNDIFGLDYSIVGAADGYLLLQAYPLLYFAQ